MMTYHFYIELFYHSGSLSYERKSLFFFHAFQYLSVCFHILVKFRVRNYSLDRILGKGLRSKAMYKDAVFKIWNSLKTCNLDFTADAYI